MTDRPNNRTQPALSSAAKPAEASKFQKWKRTGNDSTQTTAEQNSSPSDSSDIITPRALLSEGWIAETNGWDAANRRILTARRMIALADFSAGDPSRWRTIRARFFFEELSVNELAEKLGISRRTVARHLQPVHISEDIYDFPDFIHS